MAGYDPNGSYYGYHAPDAYMKALGLGGSTNSGGQYVGLNGANGDWYYADAAAAVPTQYQGKEGSHWVGSDGNYYRYWGGELQKFGAPAGSSAAAPAESFSIPSDAYPKSYSGLPDWGLEPLKQIAGALPGLMNSFDSAISAYGDWTPSDYGKDIDNWAAGQRDAFLASQKDFSDVIRAPLEGLSSRGVLDSSITRDAMTNLGGLMADDLTTHSASVAAQALGQKSDAAKWLNEAKSSQLQNIASLRAAQTGAYGDLLGLAQQSTSENKGALYASLLAALLG